MIKAPDLSGFDWERLARETLEAGKVDRSVTTVNLHLHFGYFQLLMSFMGFEEGLCALYEERMSAGPCLITCVIFILL